MQNRCTVLEGVKGEEVKTEEEEEDNRNMINEPKQKERETSKINEPKEISKNKCNVKKIDIDSIEECIQRISSDK